MLYRMPQTKVIFHVSETCSGTMVTTVSNGAFDLEFSRGKRKRAQQGGAAKIVNNHNGKNF